jgi:hypothetical protein
LYIGAPMTIVRRKELIEHGRVGECLSVRCGSGSATRSRVTTCSPQFETFNCSTIESVRWRLALFSLMLLLSIEG